MIQRTYIRTEDGDYVDHDFYGIAGLGDELKTELQIRVTKSPEGDSGQLIINTDHGDYPLEIGFDLASDKADLLIRVLGGQP